MTVGKSVLEKSDRTMWHSELMPCLQKFFEKSFQTPSSQNRIEEGVGSEEEDATERKGFQDEVDLCLGAIETD